MHVPLRQVPEVTLQVVHNGKTHAVRFERGTSFCAEATCAANDPRRFGYGRRAERPSTKVCTQFGWLARSDAWGI
jgi:hypothetical protein